ncbi:ubiquitin-like superfamily protein isoform X2 [Wolffia australiana]
MDGTSGDVFSVRRPAEDQPETTVQINVKTLDAQTYTLRVNKCVPVPDLKEQIANLTGILSGQQRLICQGKVLNDDQLLSAYHVEDGHTLHLVVRHPPSSLSTSSARLDDAPGLSGSSASLDRIQGSLGPNLLFGAVNLGDPGISGTSDLNQVLSALLSSLGTNNIRPINERPDSSVENNSRSERTPGSTQPETQQNTFVPQNVHYLAQHQHPMVIPDSLTTLSQFLSHLRSQFGVRDNELGDGQNITAALNSPLEQRGLPTPARLREILLSSRQLLMDLVGQSLYDLAKRLEEQAVITDPLVRARIQFEAGRFGSLFQNVGSLLLELGRTVMTLDMGQTPSEAVVNAGPAIFVTSSAAAPLMVQAGISVGRAPTGAQNLTHAPDNLTGNINIRIHRATPSSRELPPSGASNAAGRASSAGQLAQRLMGGRFAEARGPHGLPLRTVVAMSAGIARPPPLDSSSSGSAQLLYPLFARVSQRPPGSLNGARIPQAPGLRTPEPSAARGPPGDSAGGETAGSVSGGEEPPPRDGGDGQFFASLVRQLMPFISQNESEAGSSSSSRHPPPHGPEDRESKRFKSE